MTSGGFCTLHVPVFELKMHCNDMQEEVTGNNQKQHLVLRQTVPT